MKRKFGVLFMVLGAALVLGAMSLFLWNQQENQQAELFTQELIPVIQEQIEQVRQTTPLQMEIAENTPVELLTEEDLVMTEKEINGHAYIGYLTIPDLNLQLPVMSDWSYQKLKISPCRYSGTMRGENLVLMAHSYSSHFGHLSRLSEGSTVQFTDMDGTMWDFEVSAMDILDPYAVEEMTAGDYDLTLFTCTPNSSHRVTVRCNMIK